MKIFSRIIVAIAAVVASIHINAQAQFKINERTAVMDSLTGTWLCSVPEECFGGSYEAWSIALDNLTDITIDGENATNGYTFNNLNGTRTWSVKGTTPQIGRAHV